MVLAAVIRQSLVATGYLVKLISMLAGEPGWLRQTFRRVIANETLVLTPKMVFGVLDPVGSAHGTLVVTAILR